MSSVQLLVLLQTACVMSGKSFNLMVSQVPSASWEEHNLPKRDCEDTTVPQEILRHDSNMAWINTHSENKFPFPSCL